ncbi:single-stranded nucleic acid binding R3H domain protein [Desulfatibacillum aliphaticivorans]|uniref:RNA-binding protein KhpB n=1 Tax=Desulfatibacillum aliphaticivorans TaxID=218208 RepID=B8FMU6_DESAL|nr:RNA-binding cell elongation regulator Jag/EloR [Desulfatibacillum aliphaticivorans]ACL05816.1 single-stranded nucleic acid binding R3H domain protein [Desulfatibacillum aliphaticivorans]
MNSNVEFEGKTAEDAVELACKELGVSKKQLKYDVLSYGSTGIFGLVGVKKARIRVYPSAANAEAKKGRKSGAAKGKGRKPKKAAEPKPAQVEEEPATPEACEPAAENAPEPVEATIAEEVPETQAPQEDQTALEEAQEMEADLADDADENEPNEAAEDDPNLEQCMELAIEASVTMARTIAEEAAGKASQNEDGDIVVTLECEKPAVLIGRRGQTLDAIQYLVEKIVNRARSKKIRVRVDAGDYLLKREESLIKQAKRLGAKVRKSGKPASFSPMSAHDRRIVHLALKNEKGIRTQSKGNGYLRKLVVFPQRGQAKKQS